MARGVAREAAMQLIYENMLGGDGGEETLRDLMGFAPQEVERYMRLLISGEDTAAERLRMLEKRRDAALDEIHLKEKQLQRLDDLRYKMHAQKA